MTKQKNKVQLCLELEEAQKRIAELEQANQLKASIHSGSAEQVRHGDDAFYRSFIEQTNDGIVILDEQGNVSVWNSAQENIMGIPREEVIGQKYWDVQFRVSTPETRARLSLENIKDAFQSTFKTGEHPSLGKFRDVEIQLEDGRRKFIQISPFTVKTEDGFRIGSITRDITEQRHAADASRENEERFSQVFHSSPAQMAITDTSTGKYIDVNKSFLQSLGFTREEVIDKTASELNLFIDSGQRAALLEKMKEQGSLQDEPVQVRAKSGNIRHGVFSAKYIQAQDRQFLLTVMNDITERRQMEDALSKNQQILLETQSVAKLQSWVANFQTGELIIGPGYDHILEQAAGVYKLDDIRNFIHPQDREYVEKAWAQAAQDQSLDIEYRILLNGDMKWVHTKTNTIPNENEKTASVPGFTQDVTERRQAEELTHAQRNLARLASTTTSIEEALPHCLNAALNVSGMDCGGVYLFDTDQQSLDLVYHQGLGMDFIQAISHYPAHASNVQTVLAGMMFYFAEKDMEKDKAHQKEGLQSLAVIPILDHGHVLGCINIGSHTLKQIPEVARQAIETITTEIGTVIAHLQTENLLRDSEKKHKSLIDSQTHFVIRVNMEGKYVYWNNQFEKEFGWVYSPEGLQNGDVMRTIYKHHHQRVFEVVQQCITQPGKVISVEIDKPARNGGIRTTLWEFMCLTDERNLPSEIQCMGMEITDRKKAEETLHQTEKRNTLLIEHAPDGIALVDVNGVFTFASPSAYRMFGYGPEEIIGKQSWEKVHPQDLHLVANLQGKLLNTPEAPQTIEYRFQHKDGSYRWLESTYTNMFDEPSVEGIVINFRDITDRKLAAEITRQKGEQLQLLYEASQQLNRTLDVKEIYQTICDFMAIIAPSDTLFISVFDDETQLISCSAYWMDGVWLDVSPFPSIPLEEEGKGTQSRVIHSGQAMLLNDYQAFLKTAQNIYYVNDETNEVNNDAPEEDDEDVTRSAMIVPLKSGGAVKGVIQVASYHQDAYTDEQLKLLEALSLHIASAEQNALLYTQLLGELNERKQVEEALRTSEEKYRVLIESFDNVVVSVDRQGKILYMNDMAAEQLGNSAEELIGKNMRELFPEEVVAEQSQAIKQVIREDKGIVYETIMMLQGEPRWYRISTQPIHDDDGHVSQVLINSTDIHGLKTTQQELQDLNRTLEERVQQRTAEVQDLYDNAPAGYHSLDSSGCIILINETKLKWMGYTREEMIGQPIQKFLTPASLNIFKESFPAFKQRGWLKDLELEFTRKDGTILPVLINATAIHDEHGNFLLSRSTLMDNTEHKAVDEALRNANLELARAMRMKDEFLASMSHELRTPLNGILGLSEALQLDVYGVLTDKQKSTLGHIEDSGRHLLELINDILDVSKIEAGKFELEMAPCSLGDICQSSIQLTKGMAGKKKQNVNFTMNPASITINADGRRLKQVLVNLLSNAVKFTPESGSLGMEVTEDAANKIVHITVWDNGIGISAENIKKLFQPFVQLDSSLSRQQTGTGLGLTLVQRLVEMHRGSIEIQSTPGQGSRFTVALSCMSADSTAEFVENIFQSKFHYALIVEDESMDAGHLARYCRSLGISPILHTTGADALERVLATRPNIVFLDIHLPDISGWDVLVQLKANPETRHIPVVITSVDDEKQKAHQLKADGYLVKFFAVSDLRTILINLQKTPSANEISNIPSDGPIATVIIVDDNEINIETVEDYLGTKNFNVISARSGVDFLDRVSHLHPDIVLMDIQMPEMDGLETIRRLRGMTDQKLASVPVIALTALAMPGDREHCIEAGADEYVTKPFRLREIQELIMQMLEDKKRTLQGIVES